MPRFSIIMPCYNAAETLMDTLDSLRSQSFSDWEMLCIDDGSTDATTRLLTDAAARDPRIRLLDNPERGPSAARNVAITEANGDLLAFCDADDLWMTDKLNRMNAAFADGTVAAVYARIAFFDGARTRSQSTVRAGDLTVPALLGENPVCTMSNLVVRRDVFAATGGFNTKLVHNEDLEWLVRLIAQGYRLSGIDECLVRYRTSVTGLSADLEAMQSGRQAALATAAHYGFSTNPCAEAVYYRYLARRALRVGAPGRDALRFALAGIATSPRGFFSDFRRGGLTLLGAVVGSAIPAPLHRALFAS